MAFTFDPSTDLGKVRLIISDTDTVTVANQMFTDASIEAYLSIEDGDVRLAAADALDTIASTQTLLLKAVTLGPIKTDGPSVAKALREHAQTLRGQVYTLEPAFDIAEMVLNPASAAQVIYNDAMRHI